MQTLWHSPPFSLQCILLSHSRSYRLLYCSESRRKQPNSANTTQTALTATTPTWFLAIIISVCNLRDCSSSERTSRSETTTAIIGCKTVDIAFQEPLNVDFQSLDAKHGAAPAGMSSVLRPQVTTLTVCDSLRHSGSERPCCGGSDGTKDGALESLSDIAGCRSRS